MTLLVSDICSWFQLQQGATRLETVVNLLQMLYPLELQFVGACLEDLVRRDYHCLRDVEHRFNIPDIVARLTDLNDGRCRASLIVALSLLKSTNHSTASTVYRILFSFHVLFQQLPRTKDVIDEILLLLTMAKHHPAFKFEQKNSIACLFDEIVNLLRDNDTDNGLGTSGKNTSTTIAAAEQNNVCENDSNTKSTFGANNVHESTTTCCCVATQTSQEDISEYLMATPTVMKIPSIPAKAVTGSTKLLGPQAAAILSAVTDQHSGGTILTAAKNFVPVSGLVAHYEVFVAKAKIIRHEFHETACEFLIEVTWSNGMVTEIIRTQEDLYEFHRQLLDLNPSEAGCYGATRHIPYFPGNGCSSAEPKITVTGAQSSSSTSSPDIVRVVYSYFQDFLAVNSDILSSKCAARFFKDEDVDDEDEEVEDEENEDGADGDGIGRCSQDGPADLVADADPDVVDVDGEFDLDGVDVEVNCSSVACSSAGSSSVVSLFDDSSLYLNVLFGPGGAQLQQQQQAPPLTPKEPQPTPPALNVAGSNTTSPDLTQQVSSDNTLNEDEQDLVDEEGRLKSFTFHNSQMNSTTSSSKALTTTTPPNAYFKQQQPIRCLLPAASYETPPQPNFAHCCYAPTLPPPIAYNLQGAPNFPFFAPFMPPPGHPAAGFRFICGPPPPNAVSAPAAMVTVAPSCQCHNAGRCQLCLSSSNRS